MHAINDFTFFKYRVNRPYLCYLKLIILRTILDWVPNFLQDHVFIEFFNSIYYAD